MSSSPEGFVFTDKDTAGYSALSVGAFSSRHPDQKFRLCADISNSDAVSALRISGENMRLTAMIDIEENEIALKPKCAKGVVSLDGRKACLTSAALPVNFDVDAFVFPAIGRSVATYDKSVQAQISISSISISFEDQ